MPILPPSSLPPNGCTTSVQTVLGQVSNDLLLRMGPAHPSLLDYVNRIQLDILKVSRFKWLWSPPQKFLTVLGQTDYWIGPGTGLPPVAGTAPTGLQLGDVQFIQEGTVYDRTNKTNLTRIQSAPNQLTSSFADGSF